MIRCRAESSAEGAAVEAVEAVVDALEPRGPETVFLAYGAAAVEAGPRAAALA